MSKEGGYHLSVEEAMRLCGEAGDFSDLVHANQIASAYGAKHACEDHFAVQGICFVAGIIEGKRRERERWRKRQGVREA